MHYFSSAGNQSDQQAYDEPLRIVGPDGAMHASNIDLTGVDPALYSGGLHDFDAGDGVDVAQDVSSRGTGTDDPPVGRPVRPERPDAGRPVADAPPAS